MSMLPRLDPAARPAAGKPTYHDSAHDDYRWALRSSQSPTRKLQTAEWTSHSEDYKRLKQPAIKAPGTSTPGPSKPDHFYVNDIPAAAPNGLPGLTVNLPWRSGSASEPSTLTRSSHTGADVPSPSGARPPRATNPLSPEYPWPPPSAGGQHRVFPTAAAEPGEWRQHAAVRTGSLNTGDVAGARTGPYTRSRRDSYSAFDYSDVRTSSRSPLKEKMQREGRELLQQPDPKRLGMWGTSGDTGRLLQSHRQPTDPLQPKYHIHGREVSDATAPGLRSYASVAATSGQASGGAAMGAAGTASSSSQQQQAQTQAQSHGRGASRQGVPNTGRAEVPLVDTMQAFGRFSNQNARSPQRAGYGRNFAHKDVMKPSEVRSYSIPPPPPEAPPRRRV